MTGETVGKLGENWDRRLLPHVGGPRPAPAPVVEEPPLIRLDWGNRFKTSTPAYVYYRREKCYVCNKGTWLRDPDTGRPCHKVCAEQLLNRST